VTDVTLAAPDPSFVRPRPSRRAARPTEEPRWVRWTLTALALLLLGLLVLAPLTTVFVEALREGAALAIKSLGEPDARAAIRLTLTVAAVAVPLNALFGIAAAWVLTKYQWRGKALLLTLIDLPFSVSPVVAGLCIVLLFGANSALGAWLVAAGYPILFAVPGIVLATMFITFPFVARELVPS
jgi:sulfate transport system permease protein